MVASVALPGLDRSDIILGLGEPGKSIDSRDCICIFIFGSVFIRPFSVYLQTYLFSTA
eukprot:UN10046